MIDILAESVFDDTALADGERRIVLDGPVQHVEKIVKTPDLIINFQKLRIAGRRQGKSGLAIL